MRERTILVQRAIVLGGEDDTKTTQHRTIRLLAPLKLDLAEWRLASGRPDGDALIFPGHDGGPWTVAAYASWRRRAFDRAVAGSDIGHATPYALRHSFASLLLHEGRSVIYVARQLGHDARLTLTRYGHVVDELEDAPQLDAEEAIWRARVPRDVPSQFPAGPEAASQSAAVPVRISQVQGFPPMEPTGLEPVTSCLQSRRSPS